MTPEQEKVAAQLIFHLDNLKNCNINVKKDGQVGVINYRSFVYKDFDDAWGNNLKYSNWPKRTFPDYKDKPRVEVNYE